MKFSIFNFPSSKKISRGFTLVETLVAVSIFSTSILVLMTVLSEGITDTTYAKRKITSGYLAQEGIEYVRNMRDTYSLYSSSGQAGWDAFKNKLTAASCSGANGCYFDDRNIFSGGSLPMTTLIFTACGSSCPNLLYDATTGRYGYASGSNSGLQRKITMSQITNNEVQITSTVYWSQGSGTRSITLVENMFNWIEQ